MKFCKIVDGRVVATIQGGSLSAPEGYTEVPAEVDIGWTIASDGSYIPPINLKTTYTHREFILRLGSHHAAIQRLRDENNALPPDQKNYELERLFQLWERSQDINLDDQDLHVAFDTFVSIGLMSREDADNVLIPNEIL